MFQRLDDLNGELVREVEAAIPSVTRQLGDIVHRLRRSNPSKLPLPTLCDTVDQHVRMASDVVLEHMRFLAQQGMRYGERQGVGALEMFQIGVMQDVDGACDAFEVCAAPRPTAIRPWCSLPCNALVPVAACTLARLSQKPLYEAEKKVKDAYGKFVEGKDGARRQRLEASRNVISDVLSTERGLCSLARAVQVVSEARSRPRF